MEVTADKTLNKNSSVNLKIFQVYYRPKHMIQDKTEYLHELRIEKVLLNKTKKTKIKQNTNPNRKNGKFHFCSSRYYKEREKNKHKGIFETHNRGLISGIQSLLGH